MARIVQLHQPAANNIHNGDITLNVLALALPLTSACTPGCIAIGAGSRVLHSPTSLRPYQISVLGCYVSSILDSRQA